MLVLEGSNTWQGARSTQPRLLLSSRMICRLEACDMEENIVEASKAIQSFDLQCSGSKVAQDMLVRVQGLPASDD